MESRNKLAKTLVRLNLAGEAPTGSRLVDAEGRNVGTLTSVARIEDGSVVGLGFVKPDSAESGTQLQVGAAEETSDPLNIAAEVLPAVHSTRRQEIK